MAPNEQDELTRAGVAADAIDQLTTDIGTEVDDVAKIVTDTVAELRAADHGPAISALADRLEGKVLNLGAISDKLKAIKVDPAPAVDPNAPDPNAP